MEKFQKPSFIDLVKTEIQDLDESLSSIPNLWGEDPRPLTQICILMVSDGHVSFTLDEKYKIPPLIKQKVEELFFSDRWANISL
jgi:hypothetical protein